ncbi:MAG: cohesin domain-containing protein [Clostridia bacterium]|nr:cohesin domain-containing protein [Clostridia bacterium]
MKKTLSILLALALVLSLGVMTVFAASTDGKVVLTADKSAAKVGDVITFTVTATPDSTNGLGALDFNVQYNPAKFELVSASDAAYFNTVSFNTAVAGNLQYSGTALAAVTTTGPVVTFQLKVLETNGVVDLNVTSYALGDFDGTDATDSAIANAGSAAAVTVACDHAYGDWTVTTPATCTTAGEETHTCTACGATETRPTALAAHTPGDWEVVTPATCTEAGVEVQKCTECGTELDSRAIPAPGHEVADDAWVVETPATCTESGLKKAVCSVCGEEVEEVIAALGHDVADDAWVVETPATCTEPGLKKAVCAVCGDEVEEVIAPLGHSYGEWVVTKEPTATAEGSKERVCSVCGEKEVVAIDKLTVTTDTSVPNIPKTSGTVAGGIAALAMLSMAAGVAAVTMKKKHEDD